MIHADATMQIDLVRHYLPRIETALDLDVETPHMRVTQVIQAAAPIGLCSPLAAWRRCWISRGLVTPIHDRQEAIARSRNL